MDSKNKKPNHSRLPHKKGFEKRKPLLSPSKGVIIGITGGIATGKTFVLECFKKLGFEVFNADEAVHKLIRKDGKAFSAIAVLCPEAVVEDGIDRKILGESILSNQDKLRQVEAILHPLVHQAQVAFMVNVKNTSGKSMVFEVPLLYENKREQFYNHVVVTTTSENVQKQRAMTRKNMTQEKFDAIIKRQMPNAAKIKKADFVIKTDKTLEETFKQVKSIVQHAGNKGDRPRHRDHRPNKKR